MRVVLVVESFPKPSETFFVTRFRHLLERGWDMHVVCRSDDGADWSFFPELMRISGVTDRVRRRPATSPRWWALALLPVVVARTFVGQPRATLRYVMRGWRRFGLRVLVRLYHDAPIVRLRPDVVHVTFGSLAKGAEHLGALLDCAFLVSFQGADVNYAGLDEEPGYYADVWTNASGLHFQGQDLLRRAQRRGFAPDGRECVILPGVDAHAFAPSERRGQHDGSLRILSVGRLHWKKGYEYALDAVARLRDRGVACRYRVIGGGELYDALLFARDDLGLNDVVELLGPLPPSQVVEQMRWADVLLHAATSEGFCYAVVEAQAMELPVVTSDADGLGENVADSKTGFVVPRRDPEALTAALAKLAADAHLCHRMGAAGRQRVLARFGVDREIDEWEKFYRRAAAGSEQG